jgi:hypothetical protein
VKPIRLVLHRIFKQVKAQEDDESSFHPDWLEYPGINKSDLEWGDLLARRVVVVLGEAGMGKTWEFEDKVKRLEAEGKPAFFIALTVPTRQQEMGHSWSKFASEICCVN